MDKLVSRPWLGPAPCFDHIDTSLETDALGRCLDEAGAIIPGLYAAGNVQGRRFADDYPTVMPGFSHSLALSYGRLTGQTAATEGGAAYGF